MNDRDREILDILQEECAEVIQMVSKCRRFGIDTLHIKSGQSNRQQLVEEIGDLMAMIELCIENGIVGENDVLEARTNKINKLKQWSTIFGHAA